MVNITIKDLETIRLLNFDCDIAIDANESLTKPSFFTISQRKYIRYYIY